MDRLIAWYRVGSSAGAVAALVVANAIPLAGVLFLGWNVWTILIVYWIENGIVGVFNVLKMIKAQGVPEGAQSTWLINGRPAGDVGKVSIVPFFIMHYGIFWTVHGVFVLTLPVFGGISGDAADLIGGIQPWSIVLATVGLFISHGVSYSFNFLGRGEYLRVSAATQMFAPYGRLIVLHLTIIVGALAIGITGAPAVAVGILVVGKTVMDVGLHLAEHRRATAPDGKTPAV